MKDSNPWVRVFSKGGCAGKSGRTNSEEEEMPVWFLVLLLAVLVFAVVLAIGIAYSRRSAGGHNTTIIERHPSSESQSTTVVEAD